MTKTMATARTAVYAETTHSLITQQNSCARDERRASDVVSVLGGSVFERREKKYLITYQAYEELRPLLCSHVEQDTYGVSSVCSLYLDTPDRRIIRTSLQDPVYKEKIRMRSYGACASFDDLVYFELKKKYKGVVYKRRVQMMAREALAFLNRGALPASVVVGASDTMQSARDRQILSELGWALEFYAPLELAMNISCERLALFGIEEPDLRITFDANVRWSDKDFSGLPEDGSTLLLPPNVMIMEVKFQRAIPLWLAQVLGSLDILPQSFSKYGTAYQLSKQIKNSSSPLGG